MDYSKDYYAILEVDKNATSEILKSAYRRLAMLHHPDKNLGDPESEERFKSINEAYEVLSSEITRHIYDEYHEALLETDPVAEKVNTKKTGKKRTIKREKRVYVSGTIVVKFQGEPEMVDSYMMQWEQKFRIYPTESVVTINDTGIFKDGTSREYDRSYSSAELFAVPLPQPMNCRIITLGGEEHYLLTVFDIKIKAPVIKDVTRQEQFSYGTLEGEFFGYVVHTYDEEVPDNSEEYTGPTGKVETKEEAGVYFTREELYNGDGSRYWNEWKARPGVTKNKKTTSTSPSYQFSDKNDSIWFWLIVFLIGLLIWPKLFLGIALIWGILFLVYLLISFLRIPGRFLTVLSAILLLTALFLGARSFVTGTGTVPNKPAPVVRREIETDNKPAGKNNNDTLISHIVKWNDYDSNSYSVRLSVLQSVVNTSRRQHALMSDKDLPRNEPAGMYDALIKMDEAGMNYVNQSFDSIRKVNNLNEIQTAKMIVTCIQSIPYFLVLDKSCDDKYSDPYISQYLSTCRDDCCIGNIKYGVQSPAEFISNLKGDCDTRALILYELLGRQGVDVALMTSEFYKHAMIAVHFRDEEIPGGLSVPVGDSNFYMWETTSAGNRPGDIAPAFRNLQYWDITLIHQQ